MDVLYSTGPAGLLFYQSRLSLSVGNGLTINTQLLLFIPIMCMWNFIDFKKEFDLVPHNELLYKV